MTIQAVTTFIVLQSPNGNIQGRYQNSVVGETLTYESQQYIFLNFIYSGATKSRMSDNISSDLALAANQISINIASEAVQYFWSIQVDSVLMHPQTFTPTRALSREYWVSSGISYNTEVVKIELSSAIDAIGADAPNRRLLERYVGALPLTSRISNQ